MHTQIVLCPGFNDGDELERTIRDLFSLHPGVLSLAVVPVGLTGYRERLPALRPPTSGEAASTLAVIHGFQQRFMAECGSRFVFAADELYLKAQLEFPPLAAYEDLAQLENGVGLIPLFRGEARQVLEEVGPLTLPVISTFTGESFFAELERFLQDFSAQSGTQIHLHEIKNEFFGGFVTVTGLLTGRDVVAQLRGKPLGDLLLVPDVVLKEGADVFLDDLSLADLENELGVRVCKIPVSPWGFLEAMETLAD